MTDDTDQDGQEGDRTVSLPLIDTFAAMAAELDAKSDRIERLESELDRGYLDPDGGDADPDAAGSDDDPMTHEDWEPETDPLEDTGAATAEGDHEGVTPSAGSSFRDTVGNADPNGAESGDDGGSTPAPESTAGADSGPSPVRTASSERSRESGATEGEEPPATDRRPDEHAAAEFGVRMETSSDLTGGSLGSSVDGGDAARGGTGRAGGDAASEPDTLPDPTADRGERLSRLVRHAELRDEGEVVEAFVEGIDALDEVTREMLAHYREAGDAAPVDAHVAAGGSGERQYAYARNRTLRKAGVIEHDGAGRYRYALPDLVAEAFDGNAAPETVADAVGRIESATGLDA